MPQKEEELRTWYDGYLFGGSEVYNPWSVTRYVKEHTANIDAFPEAYWANTSSNMIIKEMIYQAGADEKRELEELAARISSFTRWSRWIPPIFSRSSNVKNLIR